MKALFERVTAARLSLTAGVLAALMLSACGGGKTEDTATASATGGGITTTATPSPASASTPTVPAPGTNSPAVGSLSLTWAAPVTNSDGTPVSDLAGYRVYYGTASGFYTDSVTISNPATTGTTISNLPAATYYVIVRAFNSANTESLASAEVSKTIQ